MGTVATSTQNTATAFSNQRKVDRTQNGVLWSVYASQPGQLRTACSTDGGATWTDAGNIVTNSQVGYTLNSSLFIDVDDYAHVAYKDTSQGYIYYQRGTPNAARTAYTWSSTFPLYTDSTGGDYPDVWAHREGSGWAAHVVHSVSNAGVFYRRVSISSTQALTGGSPVSLAASEGSRSAHTYPSIDGRHTGDGKTVAGGMPDLYVGWSAGAAGSGAGIRFRKASYSGGSWSWGTEREIDNNVYVNGSATWLNTLFDGTRVLLAGQLSSGPAPIVIHERDAADTTTVIRSVVATTSASTEMLYGSASFDTLGNVYIFGVDETGANGTRKVSSRRWVRSSGVFEGAAVFDATGINAPFISARRGPQGAAIDYVHTDGTASPYTVTSGRITLNAAPTAATPTTPTTGSAVDRTQPITLAWVFNDPDAGDSQSKADVRYKLTSASTWTTILGATTVATSYALPANQTAGDYEWQVLTYDAQGVASPWSTSSFFTAANPPQTPTITAPSNGGTVSTASYTVTWSAPQQDAYEVRRVADNAGSPVPGTVYSTTGTVEDNSSRARTLTFETNQRTEHVQVRVRYQGIWSTWGSARALVSYTVPPTPVAVLTPDNDLARMLVAITNPTPTGSQPTVTSVEVWVNDGLGDGLTRRAVNVPPNSTYSYDLPRSFFDYVGNVKVVAVGANGTSSETFAT